MSELEDEPFLKSRGDENRWNFLARLFFWQAFPIIAKGSARELDFDDLAPNLEENGARALGDELEKALKDENFTFSKRPLLKALRKIYFWPYVYLSCILLVRDGILRAGQALFLGWFIRAFTSGGHQSAAIYNGVGLLCTMIFFVLLFQHSTFISVHLAMKMRIAVSTVVYRKTLRLNQTGLRAIGVGQITNFLASDVGLFEYGIQYSPFLWVAPISAVLSAAIIWSYVGGAALPGFGIALLLVPLQGVSYKFFSALRLKCAGFTDARLRLVNEVLNGILLIKMSTWERPFGDLVSRARRSEVNVMRKKALLNGSIVSLLQVTPKISLFLTLLVFFLQGNTLDAETAFVTSNLFGGVATMLTTFLPFSIIYGAEMLISIKRIDKFLASDERAFSKLRRTKYKKHGSVILDSIYTKWTQNGDDGLKNVSLSLTAGKLVTVIGPVGAGKTSLLLTILKEMEVTSGEVTVDGSFAYTSQSPCLFSGTVRDNILFGKAYDPEWYQRVVDACALSRDFELLPNGDLSLVADKGVTLSGGQKSRISLARAVYHNADIYLLDDPFSSVDAGVGLHLYEKCLRGLLKSKAVLLVTHLTNLCKDADEILALEHGEVVSRGTYDQLSQLGVIAATQMTDKVDDVAGESGGSPGTLPQVDDVQEKKAEAEKRAQGRIGLGLVLKYLKFGNNAFIVAVVVLLSLLNQALLSGSDVMLKYWTNATSKHGLYSAQDRYLYYYTILMVPLVLVPFVRCLVHYWSCLRSAERMHGAMFSAVVNAPMKFFETNSLGRIMNRFSKDMRSADDVLPQMTQVVTAMALQTLYTLVLVGWVNPVLFIPAVILLIASFFVRRFYLRAASSIARLETTAKSPVLSHLGASIHGLTTIRAYRVQDTFEWKFDDLQDAHSAASYAQFTGMRWLGITVQMLFSVYFAIVAASFIMESGIDASTVGFAIPSTLFLSAALANVLSQSADMENQLVSVERILEYTKLEPEEMESQNLDQFSKYAPPKDWPSRGGITFDHVSVSYSPGKNVLHNICCHISPKEKIGIVGRTGAGKTTLVSAIFRIVNPSSGCIVIDDIDIGAVSLKTLRSKIAIIPQEPIVFAGTLRTNLDPLSEFDDASLWTVLRETQLDKRVSGSDGLETEMGESGANFSHGQRQLLSLARALLRRCKILVLDEATAHVDSETDQLIQKLVRDKFRSCTVITIAHRLGTVMDSDRVCVMEGGEIMEFDSPKVLLADENSRFSKLQRSTASKGVDS